MNPASSIGNVIDAALLFLTTFSETAGEDHATLMGDIATGTWDEPNAVTDPAAWDLWVVSLWEASGVIVTARVGDESYALVIDEDPYTAVVRNGERCTYSPERIPHETGRLVEKSQLSEVSAMQEFRGWITYAWKTLGIVTIEGLMREIQNPSSQAHTALKHELSTSYRAGA